MSSEPLTLPLIESDESVRKRIAKALAPELVLDSDLRLVIINGVLKDVATKSDVEKLSQQIEEIKKEISSLRERLARVEGELSQLNKRLDDLNKRIDDLDKRIDLVTKVGYMLVGGVILSFIAQIIVILITR